MKTLIILILLPCSTALAAIHPTKAQAAYFAEHDKCVGALRAAQKDAKGAPAGDQKKLLDVAKQSYRQCEHHAHLVWKFYPHPPPAPPQ